MMSMPHILFIMLLLATPVAGSGQTAPTSSNEAMRKLDLLIGEWKGRGWHYGANGSKVEVSQSTKVKMDADGATLRIKDAKWSRGDSLPGAPLNHPESTVSYDDQAKLYRWHVKSSQRRGNPFEVRLPEPMTFQLVLHTPDSMFRTTIRVTEDGEWHETLEFLMAERWFKAQETVLKKVK